MMNLQHRVQINIADRSGQKKQVLGSKKPLYEGHILDRNIHIGNFDVPEDSLWSGQRLNELDRKSVI